MTDLEIINALGGVTALAKLLSIKPPSVHAWGHRGIPDLRLQQIAAHLEVVTDGKFSRKKHWPDNYAFYWPELAQTPKNIAQNA